MYVCLFCFAIYKTREEGGKRQKKGIWGECQMSFDWQGHTSVGGVWQTREGSRRACHTCHVMTITQQHTHKGRPLNCLSPRWGGDWVGRLTSPFFFLPHVFIRSSRAAIETCVLNAPHTPFFPKGASLISNPSQPTELISSSSSSDEDNWICVWEVEQGQFSGLIEWAGSHQGPISLSPSWIN